MFFFACRQVNCTNAVIDDLDSLLPATIYFLCFEYDNLVNELSYNLTLSSVISAYFFTNDKKYCELKFSSLALDRKDFSSETLSESCFCSLVIRRLFDEGK